MKRLVLFNPLHAGSHAAWSEGLQRALATAGWHVELHALPGRHWKWRMQGAALWFAGQIAGPAPDVLLTTDMLDAARLRGSLPPAWRNVPLISYFHENQVSFPFTSRENRDQRLAYAFVNLQSAWASDAVWFNSAHHQDAFLNGINAVLQRMPDARIPGLEAHVRERSAVVPLGLELPDLQEFKLNRPLNRPLRLVWNHRWESDKHPEHFIATCDALIRKGIPFEVDLLGMGPRDADQPLMQWALAHPDRVVNVNPADGRAEYWDRLLAADALVHHPLQEYFGLSVMEALHAGVLPILPNAHAYPEYVKGFEFADTPQQAARAVGLMQRAPDSVVRGWRAATHALAQDYRWERILPRFLACLEQVRDAHQ